MGMLGHHGIVHRRCGTDDAICRIQHGVMMPRNRIETHCVIIGEVVVLNVIHGAIVGDMPMEESGRRESSPEHWSSKSQHGEHQTYL